MSGNLKQKDTIVALATPAGGAIGVIRVSGPEAVSITSRLFSKDLNEAHGNTLHYGNLSSLKGELLDEVVVSVYRAPHSYTGEDATEISCHGSRYILQNVLQALIEAGCRQALPGEYTQRAYLNGKMDLSQAEAVASLVASTNRATHKLALSQLRGHFSSELSHLRDQLLKMNSLLELELDFSDHEDLEFADRSELKALAQQIDDHISRLANSFETGNAIKQGVPVAIIGKTNVGKSTLLNRLLHEDLAIVSDIHGTTRDSIEDTTQINGITFRFIDTAGIRATTDKIETIGIERTWQKLEEATIILWLIDEQPSDKDIKEMQEKCAEKKLIIILNKIDKTENTSRTIDCSPFAVLPISAKYGNGIDRLEQKIYEEANIPEIQENDVIVTNSRHYEALIHAKESIERVLTSLEQDLSGDLISEDLRICLDQLSDITGGQITSQETLNNIFKHFCIGK
jgi:tRNA modification GTPase